MVSIRIYKSFSEDEKNTLFFQRIEVTCVLKWAISIIFVLSVKNVLHCFTEDDHIYDQNF